MRFVVAWGNIRYRAEDNCRADRFACETPVIRDVAKDTVRNVAHLAHEARAFKTMAVDAVEDRVADAATRIRKEPFKFVGLAFAIAVPVGLAPGWMFNAFVKAERREGEKG